MKRKQRVLLVLFLALTLLMQACGAGVADVPAVVENEVEKETGPEEASVVEAPPVGIFKGYTAPDFTLYNLEGMEVRLWDLKGKQVIVNFWQMGCPPCLAEKKVFQAFVDEYGHEEVVILSVNTRDPRPQVEAYMEENDYTFPVLFDTRENFAAVAYRVRATPTSVFIDENMVIQQRVEGMMNLDFIKERVGMK